MTENKNCRLFIIDDHPLVRAGLQHLLAAAGFQIAGQAKNTEEAFSQKAFDDCDVILLDLSLGGSSGLELIGQMRSDKRRIIVYSMHETIGIIRQSFNAGAAGYVTKRETPSIILEAILCVISGKTYQSPIVQKILADSDPADELSEQQKQIFIMLGCGLTNQQIVDKLGISVRTLESYCARIMNKMNVEGIKQLRQLAIETYRSSNLKNGFE
jgi:DNA-binding NarL/FixJ family response regulator